MLKQVMDLYEVLDDPNVTAEDVITLFKNENPKVDYKITEVKGDEGAAEFVQIKILGSRGKTRGKDAPTLGIIGTLGGIGARPAVKGFVSDGDGALTALAAGLKILKMNRLGDVLESDVIVTTHICPNAPTVPHEPVPFMGAAISDEDINFYSVTEEMDGILSIDTTKGNEIINTNGFAISNTVKDGYILSVSNHLTDIMKRTTGKMPFVFPLAQQDITPYGNDLYHMNSILQPSVITSAPVVGVAITAEVPVAGCASGATRLTDVESAARFAVEVAKEFSVNEHLFYDKDEYQKIFEKYGSMQRYQTKGIENRKDVGIIVMGQSGKEGKYDDIKRILAPEGHPIIEGIMDDYTYEEIQENFWPKEDEDFIISTIVSGETIKISETHSRRLIQDKIDKFNQRGIKAIMVFCTAEFSGFQSEGVLMQPVKAIESMLTLLGAKKIGIILPEKEQIEESYEQYRKYQPIIRAASPYGGTEHIGEVATEFFEENVDLIVCDCMGFTEEQGQLISEKSGKKVIVPRVFVPTLLKNLI